MPFLTNREFFGRIDLVFGNIVPALGGLAISIFLSYVWKIKNALKEISFGNTRFRLKPMGVFHIKFLAPAAIILILIFIRTLTG